jgi:release factor glutamine methyltransferase
MKKLLASVIIAAVVPAAAWLAARRDGNRVVVADRSSVTSSIPWKADPPELEVWRGVEDLPRNLAQFRSVFWDPRDTESLRQMIRETALVRDKTILEIGAGTGLLSLCCLNAGAAKVVATDVNPAAIANTEYNANMLGLADRLETRLVPLDRAEAYSVIEASERYDLIISNPPWENRRPGGIYDYALYDEGFRLMQSLLAGLAGHLKPGGRAFLAYGCVDAIQTLQRLALEFGLAVHTRDGRNLDELPEVFLPGMLLEVLPVAAAAGPRPAEDRRHAPYRFAKLGEMAYTIRRATRIYSRETSPRDCKSRENDSWNTP